MLAVAIALTNASAQQPPPPKTGALAPGGTGLIAGRVLDPASGTGVSGAVVWLQLDIVMRPETPRVLSDADGRFVFVNVPAGRYTLQAQKLGHTRGFFGQKTIQDEGTELAVTDGQLLTDVAVPIWKHAAIGGTVTDEAGEPVVGVSVRAFRKIVTFGEIRFTPGFQGSTALTDDRGEYRFSSLIPGEYLVAVPSTLTTFPVEVMREVFRPEITSVASGAISELSPMGFPANQQVGMSVVMGGNRAIYPPAPTDEVGGVYRTTLFPAATRLADATAIRLKPGDARSGVNITVRPVRAGAVSGLITSPEAAAGPTAIRLVPAGDAMLSASREFDAATGLSDAAGRFTLLGVPEGQYTLWVEKRPTAQPGQPPDSAPLLFGAESVTVSGGSPAAEVVVTLRPAPRVAVRLDMRDGRTVRPQDVELFIEAVGPGGRANLFPDSVRQTVAQLPPGRYLVTASYFNGACTAALSQGRDVSDEPFALGTDDVEITIVCGDTPTRLSGAVRGERGSLDSDALVVAFPADRRFWSSLDLRARRKASGATSAVGTYSIVNLPPGEYLVAAVPQADVDFWQDPQVLDKLTPLATRVSLQAGETRTVDVRTVRIK